MKINETNKKNNFMKKPGVDSVMTALFGVVFLFFVFTILNHNFISNDNLSQLLRSICPYLLVGIGQGIVCLTGNIDLSIGSVMGMSVMISASLICSGMNPLSAILIDLLCCLAAGLFNGILIGRFRLSSFIATLGSMTICRGVAQLSNGSSNTGSINAIEGTEAFRNIFYYGKLGPIYCIVIITAIVFLIFNLVTNRTGTGRHIYAIGSNCEAARLSGVSVFKTIVVIYMISAFCSFLAGLITMAAAGMGSIQAGVSYEMYGVAAAVIGGISTLGGYGLLSGTIPGAAIWAILQNGLTLANVPVAMRNIIIGVIVVVCVLLDVDSRNNDRSKKHAISSRIKTLVGVGLSAAMIIACIAIGAVDNKSSEKMMADGEDKTVKVALITMDQTDSHWHTMYSSAMEEAEKLEKEGIRIQLTWLAPEVRDTQQQLDKISAAMADNSDYIIIAATDKTSATKQLEEATARGIGVIYVDSTCEAPALATYATDNYAGGVMAGEYLLEQLSAMGVTKGTIGIVDVMTGIEATELRYQGFVSVMEGTDFTLSERQFCDGDALKAQEMAIPLINNGVVAIYAMNDGCTNGSASAVKEANLSGNPVILVGWDKNESNLEHLRNGELKGLLIQNPTLMGTSAIDAVYSLEKGEKLDPTPVNTGVSLLTKKDVE